MTKHMVSFSRMSRFVLGAGVVVGSVLIGKSLAQYFAPPVPVQARWARVEQSDSELLWESESFTVRATLYDTGEWVVHHGEKSDTALHVFAENISTKQTAIEAAHECIDTLTGDSPVLTTRN